MRKAVGVYLKKTGFWIFTSHRVMIGRRSYVQIRRAAVDAIWSGRAEPILDEPGRTLWAVGGEFFWDHDGLAADEVELVYWDRTRRKDARVERLRKIKARPDAVTLRRRELIPEDVRVFVWNRDGGRCTKCGADEDLQFDHVIPVAKGGATSIENLQLLCGDCNRAKSDLIV